MISLVILAGHLWSAPVGVVVQADSGRIPVSPWIYGKNNDLSDSDFVVYREAGLRMLRACGGNNATKYNWRTRLSSHPDWYNNVYSANWDAAAKAIQTKLPDAQGLFAFQLLGWAAKSDIANFNDWNYNQSKWWDGAVQNLAGGGSANGAGGGKASVEGNPQKYLVSWPADSTVGIVDHWFGAGGLGYDSTRLRYWNMDNEPDGWSGTHDDVVPALTGHVLSAEEYVQKYVAVAKAVRAKFPGARLVGPASMTEWHWYTWENESVTYKGRPMCFAEFFIQRLAEVQDSTGVRMLDVYDIHLYFNVPSNATLAQNLQTHRLLYDTAFASPWANGVKTVNGGWDESQKREYIFLRIRRWLDRYFGPGNGIGIGSTESGIGDPVAENASAAAVWHASMLGTMADHGTELFTPWFWYPGMWEATHLFSRRSHGTRVASRSSLDSLVSAYSSISSDGDSMTVILVNRDANSARDIDLSLSGFAADASAATLSISGLVGETFVSRTRNGLKAGTVAVAEDRASLSLPALSVTAVLLTGKGKPVGVRREAWANKAVRGLLSREGRILTLRSTPGDRLELMDAGGRVLRRALVGQDGSAAVDLERVRPGVYSVRWSHGAGKVVVAR